MALRSRIKKDTVNQLGFIDIRKKTILKENAIRIVAAKMKKNVKELQIKFSEIQEKSNKFHKFRNAPVRIIC